MKAMTAVVFLPLLLAVAGHASAQIVEEEHRDHQLAAADCQNPAVSTDAASAAPAPAAPAVKIDMAGMHAQMKDMHDMHAKMTAAKTPQDRQALMAEHMRVMQAGMKRLEELSPAMPAGKGCAMPMPDPQMHMQMHMRMQMMQALMQMMVDRVSASMAN